MNPSTVNIIKVPADQTAVVSDVLTEAAAWLIARDDGLWRLEDLTTDAIAADVAAGLYHGAWVNAELLGVVRFQLDDPFVWPDATSGEAIYLNRLAVRRRAAGGIITDAIFRWSVVRAKELGRPFLRLDCAADRPKLRRIYEKFGFRLHSEKTFGRLCVARYQLDVI